MNENLEGCRCERCIHACSKQPGWFAPGEAEKTAESMGMDFEIFKNKFLVIDHCDDHQAEDAPYVYAPRKVDVDSEGCSIRTYAEQSMRSKCIFLTEDNKCSIHSTKPYECKHTFMCRPGGWWLRDEIEKLWIEAGAPLGMR